MKKQQSVTENVSCSATLSITLSFFSLCVLHGLLSLIFTAFKVCTNFSDGMIRSRKRLRGRSVGGHAVRLAKMFKRIEKLTEKVVDVSDGQSNNQLETTIQKLERQLEQEKRGREELLATRGKKQFVLKRDFEEVLEMREGEFLDTEFEEHFGLNWSISLLRYGGMLSVYLRFETNEDNKNCEFEIEEIVLFMMKDCIWKTKVREGHLFKLEDKSVGFESFMRWNEVEEALKDRKGDCPVTIEYRVAIQRVEGFPKGRQEKYNTHIPNLTDVVLKVKDRKFHVSRQCLANHSAHFHNLFYEDYIEKGNPEVTLKDLDPYDFQNFLDVVYGEQSIRDFDVAGILVIADRYLANKVVEVCEKFLIYESKKSLKKKYDMSIQYKMGKLTKNCILKIRNMKQYEEIVSNNLEDVEDWVAKELVRKSIELSKKTDAK